MKVRSRTQYLEDDETNKAEKYKEEKIINEHEEVRGSMVSVSSMGSIFTIVPVTRIRRSSFRGIPRLLFFCDRFVARVFPKIPKNRWAHYHKPQTKRKAQTLDVSVMLTSQLEVAIGYETFFFYFSFLCFTSLLQVTNEQQRPSEVGNCRSYNGRGRRRRTF